MLDNLLFNKSFYIKTCGCQMNVHDSERISRSLLDEFGLKRVENELDASLVILNTCAVREKAAHKVYSYIGKLRKSFSKLGVTPVIGVGGCVAQVEAEKIVRSAAKINFLFGPDAIDGIPSILKRLAAGEDQIILTEFEPEEVPYNIETKIYSAKKMAFVNIMKGCDNFCTFCIVPYTRGKEKSRPLQEVVTDVKKLVNEGIMEVCLLGQNINSFGKERGESLADLLYKLGEIDGLKRLRFTTSNPQDLTDELINCFKEGEIPCLMPYFHLPVQSGNNLVLKQMKRQYSRELYREKVEKLRAVRPDIAISTDIIVGFPTETEEAFQDTMKLLEEVKYDQIYSFIYSKRPKTPAAKMKDDVPFEVKRDRLELLQKRSAEIILAKNQSLIGQTTTVFMGRTPENRSIHFEGKPQDGEFVKVKITGATAVSLRGERIEPLVNIRT